MESQQFDKIYLPEKFKKQIRQDFRITPYINYVYIYHSNKCQIILQRNMMFSNQKEPNRGPCYHFKRTNARNEAQATAQNLILTGLQFRKNY